MKKLETNATAYARETKNVDITVTTLTTALLDNVAAAGTTNNFKAKTVRIAVQSNAIRYTLDGTDPSPTVGEIIVSSPPLANVRMLSHTLAKKLKMIDAGGGTAEVEVTYFN